MTLTFVPIIIIFTIAFIMILVAISNFKKTQETVKPHYRAKSYQTTERRYISGKFSPQMELDMRLPYKRFKQLYPENNWAYKEYKRMQMQTAFRRSYSSQDNKRMVR
jgi:hypothetical protein